LPGKEKVRAWVDKNCGITKNGVEVKIQGLRMNTPAKINEKIKM